MSAYAYRMLREGKSRLVGGQGAAAVVLLLLAIGLGYWVWFGLTQRTINADDGISILSAQSILDHGIPRLPSDFIYPRGLIPHYLLAASIGSLGLNDLGIMMPSLIFGLGTLCLVYLFARDALGSRWVGVAAIALLLILQTQAFYATSPRMYISLQFFTMLAVYSGPFMADEADNPMYVSLRERLRNRFLRRIGDLGRLLETSEAWDLKTLKDGDESVCETVASALGRIGELAIPALHQAALGDEESQVRFYSVFALGWMESPAAVQALIHALDDEDEAVREIAVDALRHIKSPEAMKAVEQYSSS